MLNVKNDFYMQLQPQCSREIHFTNPKNDHAFRENMTKIYRSHLQIVYKNHSLHTHTHKRYKLLECTNEKHDVFSMTTTIAI